MSDYEQRRAVERMRYELKMIDEERSMANAAEGFADLIGHSPYLAGTGPTTLKGNVFSRLKMSLDGKPPHLATYELSPNMMALLEAFLKDQAYKRRVHADALEKKIAMRDD